MKNNENVKLSAIFFLTLLIKIFLIPYTQIVDCDAVSRVFISANWYENPYWITDGVWLPFHFYLNGFSLWVHNDMELSPVLLNILISCLSIFPFYHFVKKEFNSEGAFYSCILFIISPVLFRNSFMPLSETPFWFFTILALYFISLGFYCEKAICFFASGLMMTIGAGFRFEAWLLIPLLTFIILWKKQWKEGFIFLLASILFPVIWIYYSYLNNGSLFHPGAPVLSAIISDNSDINWETWARKGWFYPLSLILTIGPIASFFIIKYLTKRTIVGNTIIWIIPPAFLLLTFLYKSFSGSLMLQHRFTGILAALTIPFFSFFADEKFKYKNMIFSFIIISTISLSFAYNTRGIAFIPRLKDKNADKISIVINKHITLQSALIIDFDGWENTWYYAIKSKLKPENILINYQNNILDDFIEESIRKINTNSNCVIVLKKESELDKYFQEMIFKQHNAFKYIFENESTIIYTNAH